VAGFVMWQTNPGFMARHFMVSPQHIREGRIYTLLTSGEMPPNVPGRMPHGFLVAVGCPSTSWLPELHANKSR